MKKSISKLKKELDKIFSLFIRLREADNLGNVICCTCGVKKHYKNGMHNGHFQSRSWLATRFDEENCQVQCAACNIFRQGEQYKFAKYLDKKYGEGTAEELHVLSKRHIKLTRIDYEEKISYYKEIVKNLKKEKGIE